MASMLPFGVVWWVLEPIKKEAKMRLGNFNFVDVDPWKWRVSSGWSKPTNEEEATYEIYVEDGMNSRREILDYRTHPEFHGKKFGTLAEAVDFLIGEGLIREEEPEDDYRSGPWIKTMTDEHDEEGYQKYLNYARKLDIALANFKGTDVIK